MKRTLLTTLLTLFAAAAFAQRGGVTATVVDADTGESVVGAVLTLTPVKTPEKKQYFTSAFKGAVSIPSLAYGEYSLSGAFLGYNNLDTTFRVSASKVSLGLLKLKPGVQIETVVKEAKALRTSQKGDTVSYNAGAFKVVADADVEGLLKKMPGITVTDERKEKVDFAKPYMKVALGVVSPESAQITDVSQLDGKTLIIAKGTTAETWFEKNAPNVKLQKYDQYADAYNALLDGRGDAFSTDNTEVLAWAKINKGFKVGITKLGDEDTIAPAVQKGNKKLLNLLDSTIDAMRADGSYQKIYDKWFGTEAK